ncbi:RBBP9/YdeN family alpha/beta hydrolase [Streptomyces sp. NBC_01304]|uniref:RBBP9/YdeN family alpha/beta hydrolase n=1 Tax=Streptomyces sp. NBC_01304 TaxID=2903818 RepID=UPI002E0E4FDC|nr:alpha/beta hydrolase [Streptomyces sp. NBC_01304]
MPRTPQSPTGQARGEQPAQAFLLLHGWQNHRPAEHWQHWLADRLAALGHTVAYPQLPAPDAPDLNHWLAELTARLEALRGAARTTVVCHSLACTLWLHAVARDAVPFPVDRVLLVAPPSPSFVQQHAEIAQFTPPAPSELRLSTAAGHTRMVAADNDPCCPEGATEVYATPLGLPIDVLVGEAHLNPDAGYGAWPSVLEWCLSPSGDGPVGRR